jgi:hypothetical protein
MMPVSTGIPGLDDALGGGFRLGRLTQLRGSQWGDVAHAVDALLAAAPGPLIRLDLDASPVASITAAARASRVVYVEAPAVDVDPASAGRYLQAKLMARFSYDICASAAQLNAAIVFLTRTTPRRQGFIPSDLEANPLRFRCGVCIDLTPDGADVLATVTKDMAAPIGAPARVVRLIASPARTAPARSRPTPTAAAHGPAHAPTAPAANLAPRGH